QTSRSVRFVPTTDIRPILHSRPNRPRVELLKSLLDVGRLSETAERRNVQMLTKRDLLRSAALAAITVTTAKAVPANAQAKAEWPNLIEAKAIAEEGFIYGLPIVMNYAVMYEFAVDRTSGQFKAPFNQIDNMARVATYKDTAVVTPN